MQDDTSMVFEVSEFVDYFNQTIEYAYNRVKIYGEVSNLKLRNNIIYFDLKDNFAKVEFWGYASNLDYPIEPGMLIEVISTPRLHPKFGFKLNFFAIKLVGEGSIKKSADLLKERLLKEGLFDESRKRNIAYPPSSIGLITSIDSAAYADFIKILTNRFGGIRIVVKDVLVQGDKSSDQIIDAIQKFNSSDKLVDVLVITRGGGSPDDLQYFNSEKLVRSIASSRIPTLVAIGHESDESLAELAADKRASTPSNAAELLTPSRDVATSILDNELKSLKSFISYRINFEEQRIGGLYSDFINSAKYVMSEEEKYLDMVEEISKAYDPKLPLKRGYALIKKDGAYINSETVLRLKDSIMIETSGYNIESEIKTLEKKNGQK